MISLKKLQYRAVQIDLARQIEHMDTVLGYFDLAADAGMNMILLYLEDRIRTKTYPYPSEEESYSEEQIREMVDYAAKRGLELVPVVSPIGHTERFLAHPELTPLAELYGGVEGRFGSSGNYHEMCPLLPETAQFMDTYLAEVAALFPSEYFHIGFDEIFNMGFCERCSKVMKEQGLPILFRDTVLHYYEVMKKLGKTIMIWDDMLEQCDSVVDDLPKDIVMCAWFYRFYQRFPEARFTTSRRYDIFKKFDRWGFRYFACPNIQIKSIDTVTDYARKYEPMGMLMTNWELATQTNALAELSVRYAGLLWNEGARTGLETLTKAAEQIASSYEVAQAVAVAATYSVTNRYSLSAPNPKALELNRYGTLTAESTMAVVEHQLRNVMETDGECVQNYYVSVVYWRLSYLLRSIAYDLHQYRVGEIELDMEECAARLGEARRRFETVLSLNRQLWDKSRKGIASVRFERWLTELEKSLVTLEEIAKTAAPKQIGRLDIHFSLPEYTAASTTRITLEYADGSRYEVGCAAYKAGREVYFDRTFAIPADKVPCALNLEVAGHGAVGYCYADVTLPDVGRLIPAGIIKTYGHVEHPEYMLIDDFSTTLCGDVEMLHTYMHPELSKMPHGFTVALKAE